MENKQLQLAKDTIAKDFLHSDWESLYIHYQEIEISISDEIINKVAIEYHRLMSEWVSVDERLPEIDEEYLLYVYDEDMNQYFHTVGYFYKPMKVFNTDSCIEMKFILFWKPLPQPPK